MLAHGSHLVDTARYLFGADRGGGGAADRALRRLLLVRRRRPSPTAPLGHLDLTVAVRMDWHEGFQIYGENGSVARRRPTTPGTTRRATSTSSARPTPAGTALLGADGHFYRRQLEGLADVDPPRRADGGRRPRGRHRLGARHGGDRALGRDRQAGARSPTPGAGLMQLGIFAKTFDTRGAAADARRGRATRATRRRSSTSPASASPPCRTRSPPASPPRSPPPRPRPASRIAAVSGTYNMIHPDPAVRAAGLRRLDGPRRRLPRPWAPAHHALHRHPRPRRPVALASGQRRAGGLARPARRDGEGGRHRRAPRHRRSASSPSSPTSYSDAARGPAAARRDRQPAAPHRARPRQPLRAGGRRPSAAALVEEAVGPPRPTTSPWPTPRTAPPAAASPPPGKGVIDFAPLRRPPARGRASTAPLVTHGLAGRRGAGRGALPRGASSPRPA